MTPERMKQLGREDEIYNAIKGIRGTVIGKGLDGNLILIICMIVPPSDAKNWELVERETDHEPDSRSGK